MISIVLPVLDEEQELEQALMSVGMQAEEHEVIVADGGSVDATCEIALAHGARVIEGFRGRGRQMNAGAAQASGDILLFLHADTRLPLGALAAVERAVADPQVPGGGFLKRYDGGGPLLRTSEWFLNTVRTRLMRGLVGTQAMFVRRSLFECSGGFREWPFLEDVELSDRLRTLGRPTIIPLYVVASARRYRQRGSLRQIAVNGATLFLYRLGVSPVRLRRLYEGMR